MRQALRKGVVAAEIVPVCVGAALENKGGAQLLDAVQGLFPSPLEHAPWKGEDEAERKSSPDEPLSCVVFKTMADPFAGQLSVMRVMSGMFPPDASVLNASKDETERVGQILLLQGKAQDPGQGAGGARGPLWRWASSRTPPPGIPCARKRAPFKAVLPPLPPTLITYALAPKEKGEEDKVYSAIHKLLEEDVNLKITQDEETADVLLSGMGQLHIEISVEKARRRYKVETELKTPKVPYRETIKGRAEVQGRHKKQTGGRGQFGDCWVRIEPLPKGSGYEYVDAIVGGSIPKQYIPAVDKGIQEAAKRGFLAGCPVIDFKATVFDGSFHNVDSSEMAFKIAGSLAFKKSHGGRPSPRFWSPS